MKENYVNMSNYTPHEVVMPSPNCVSFTHTFNEIQYGVLSPKSYVCTRYGKKYTYVTWHMKSGDSIIEGHCVSGEDSELIYKYYIPPYPKQTDDIFDALDRLEVRLKTPSKIKTKTKKKDYGNA